MLVNNHLELIKYNVSEDIFENILDGYKNRIRIVKDIGNYFGGYKDKKILYFDNNEYLILQEYILAYYSDIKPSEDAAWKQVIIRKDPSLKSNTVRKDITGLQAWHFIIKKLLKYYTEEGIEECMKAKECDYSHDFAQLHYSNTDEYDKVCMHLDTYKYDMNGAYAWALAEIFPKAKEEIYSLYAQRKENPIIKSYLNYFTGMLKRRDHERTYNWIVQRVRRKINDAIMYTEGVLIYANTDGFAVTHPKRLLQESKELGEFKLEFYGVSYTFTSKNYMIFQTEEDGEKKIIGNIFYNLRKGIDLSKGVVVEYSKVLRNDQDIFGESVNRFIAEDVKLVKKEIICQR